MACNNSGVFYWPGASFLTTTALYTDVNLTNPAPDGWYSIGGIYRQISGGVLGAPTTCPACDELYCPSVLTGSGTAGKYTMNINVGSDMGAIVIRFNPESRPDKCTWTFDGVSASEYSHPIKGYMQGFVGTWGYGFPYVPPTTNPIPDCTANTGSGLGSYYTNDPAVQPPPLGPTLPTGSLNPVVPTNLSLCVNAWPGNTQTVNGFNYEWDFASSSFIPTQTGGVNDIVTMGPYTTPNTGIQSSSPANTGRRWVYMVVPKPNPTPGTLQVVVEGLDPATQWNIEVYCPVKLNPWPIGVAGGSCGATTATTLYTQYVGTNNVTPFIPGAAPYLFNGDWCFTDPDGVTPFPAGTYPVNVGGAIQCVTISSDGVITNLTTCVGTC